MAYGLEIYNASGNTVLSYTSRVPRFVQNGIFSLASGANVDITVVGMQNNDSWEVFINATPRTFIPATVTCNLHSGYFNAKNNTIGQLDNIAYWVIRS
jgi:hypothetical protein